VRAHDQRVVARRPAIKPYLLKTPPDRSSSRGSGNFPLDEYEALEETAEILSDSATLAAIEAGLAELARDDIVTLDDLRRDLDWRLIDAAEDALGLPEWAPHTGYVLCGRLHGLRSLRVGTYRIIYQLADDDQTVRVAAIRHRSIAYRADPR
jgi:mRNA-degrading endonuclease RelE of RelBE toxin-antitoxin system